jgi:hypothetical protein
MNSKAHLMLITSLMVKLKKKKKLVSNTFLSANNNYKLQDTQFATGMQKLN